MLRKFVSSLLVLFLLVGCSSKGEEATPDEGEDASEENSGEEVANDVGSMADYLKDTLNFATEMSEQRENTMMGMLFQMDKECVTGGKLYLSSDKTSDTVGVFETTDASKCIEYINSYIETLKDTANNYTPEETFKIDKAIVEQNGDGSIVAFVICDEIEVAKNEINNLLGK